MRSILLYNYYYVRVLHEDVTNCGCYIGTSACHAHHGIYHIDYKWKLAGYSLFCRVLILGSLSKKYARELPFRTSALKGDRVPSKVNVEREVA